MHCGIPRHAYIWYNGHCKDTTKHLEHTCFRIVRRMESIQTSTDKCTQWETELLYPECRSDWIHPSECQILRERENGFMLTATVTRQSCGPACTSVGPLHSQYGTYVMSCLLKDWSISHQLEVWTCRIVTFVSDRHWCWCAGGGGILALHTDDRHTDSDIRQPDPSPASVIIVDSKCSVTAL